MNNDNQNEVTNEQAYETAFQPATNLFDNATHTTSAGTLFSSASVDDGLVTIDGLQMTRETAISLGVLNANNDSTELANDSTEAANGSPELATGDAPDDAASDPFESIPDGLSEDQSSWLERATVNDGGAVTQAISDVFESGEISETTVNRLALAAGVGDPEMAHETAHAITAQLNGTVEAATGIQGASELLRLASENNPNSVKLATMSAINGDCSAAIDLAKHTYKNLDTTGYRAELESGLTEAGYKIQNSQGRLLVYGNELGEQPVHWAIASENFSLNFVD